MEAIFAIPPPSLKASTNTDTICLLVTIALYAAAIPILLYYTWKYSKFREVACMKHRSPNITIYIEFLFISMFINRILLCANGIYHYSKILRIIFILTYPISNHSVLWLCSIKYWLLYYDIQFVVHSEGNQWKTHINRHNVTYHTNWYILNKQTLGNERYLLKKVFIILLFPSLLIPVFTFLSFTSKYRTFLDLFLMTLPLALTALIWYQTPKYLDYFRVREECRMLLIIGSILIIVYLIFGFVSTFLIDKSEYFVVQLCIEYSYLVGICIGGLHLTFWTISKNRHRLFVSQKHSKLYLHYRTLNRSVSTKNKINKTATIRRRLSSTAAGFNDKFEQNETILLLISILENEHGFQMFLSHLLTEFCLESALAIIEFTQYQILMREIYGSEVMNGINLLKLPSNCIPQSTIVHDPTQESGVFEVRTIATKLLQKYIVTHSQFEINISYKLKKKLLTDLENISQLSEPKLIHLFDESIQSLLFLLNDSLARFVKTPKYKQIEKELAQEFMESEQNYLNGNETTEIQRIVTDSTHRNSAKYAKVGTPVTVTVSALESNSPHSPNIIVPTSPEVIEIEIENNRHGNDGSKEEYEPIMKLPDRTANKSTETEIVPL